MHTRIFPPEAVHIDKGCITVTGNEAWSSCRWDAQRQIAPNPVQLQGQPLDEGIAREGHGHKSSHALLEEIVVGPQ
eukprot:4330063-Karenia_brevis.AAC.1